ncbi:hypothetical protein BpHYR1_026221 [Brachionus plicatilis]|uniref:Uncharacterized protein n=1 Tax=Brachionus plicatilis TaxID=10195 RepID=A0A3M7T486_BRAPC|nr:hypothetical protein BpHYR1_026221 [Brachionus plicatilis]
MFCRNKKNYDVLNTKNTNFLTTYVINVVFVYYPFCALTSINLITPAMLWLRDQTIKEETF